MIHRWLAASLAALLSLTAAGCTASPPPSTPAPVTVIVAGVRMGSPIPLWNEYLDMRFSTDLARNAAWTFVKLDGRPSVEPALPLQVEGDNDLVRVAALQALRAEAERRLESLNADDPEVDVLAALDLATRVLDGRPGQLSIVVLDSFLQTAGALRFQDGSGGLLSADPVAVAENLFAAGELPELNGVEVVMIGSGDTVGPQDSLPATVRSALIALWTTILERAGAVVTVVHSPVSTNAAPGVLPVVTAVPIDVPEIGAGAITLPDSAIGFLPDQALLRNVDEASAVLAPFVQWLRAGPHHAYLTGTTSSAGTPEGRLQLSRDRAEVIAALLRSAGVSSDLLHTRGVGANFSGFVPDRDSAGRLDPVLAAQNRRVILELKASPLGW